MKINKYFIKTSLVLIYVALITNLYGAENASVIQKFEQHSDGVLGTSLDITVYANDQNTIEFAIEKSVAEISRLEQIFSNYRLDSELMQLNSARESKSASIELIKVIQYCNAWFEKSAGKFSCRLGQLISAWEDAEKQQIVPERPDIRSIARAANQAKLTLIVDQQLIVLDEPISLDTSGLAKGYIIDQAMLVLRDNLPGVSAIKLDIGGDAAYWGSPPDQDGWQVGIADPGRMADNAGFIGSLSLTSMAVAASGHTSRTRTIGRREFSHILMPRDGWPVENGTAAIVVAKDALTADAIATALTVQSLRDGIDWVNSMPEVEALLVAADGRQFFSQNWQQYVGQTITNNINSSLEFTLDYILPEFNVASYNRPYVSIWITDLNQKPIKNLLLLGETERWARENKRWWRRVGRRNPQLLDGVARSTRGSGEYQLRWDGVDDFGVTVPAGDYLLHFEASRENGASSYQSIPFALGGEIQLVELPATGELGTIKLKISN